jgi:Zn-dependent protease with chaperone function
LVRWATLRFALIVLFALLATVTAYDALSLRMFNAVWLVTNRPDATEDFWFTAMTEPMDGRRAVAFERAVRSAWTAGLVVPWVEKRQTNAAFDFSRHGRKHSGGAAYWPTRNVVYIHTPWSDRLSDDELVCVVGHELGHAMQAKDGIIGMVPQCGPRRRWLETQADGIAALICGTDVWERLYRTVISRQRSIPDCS